MDLTRNEIRIVTLVLFDSKRQSPFCTPSRWRCVVVRGARHATAWQDLPDERLSCLRSHRWGCSAAGGLILETKGWRVEHCVGPLGVGTLIVKPKRHVLSLADITEDEALEIGPLLRQSATAVRELTKADEVYVCLWSHGPVDIHYVVQPALPDIVAEFGVHGPRMQAAMFARGAVESSGAAAFAERARAWFAQRA